MSPDQQKTVYIVAGPTAVGKTAVAIALAKRLGTAIISADSRQCYKEMTIGTAKPSPAELQAVKHYFIDEFPVTENLNAADFESLALQYLDKIFSEHDTAVVCGGTGLYIKALCEGLDEMPAVDPEIIKEVTDGFTEHGITWLQEAIKKEDPEFYLHGEINNPARLQRALSFVRGTGHSILQYRTATKKQRPFRTIKVGLELPREVLYKRIDARVNRMMETGLLNEVKGLYNLKELKNLQTVGYSELFDHLDGNSTLAEAITKIKQHTRNYAKRQMTWFKKDAEFHWSRADDRDVVEQVLLLK